MTRLALVLATALLVVGVSGIDSVGAQMTIEQARQEGRAMAAEKRADESLVPSDVAQAAAVPGYTGNPLPQSTLFDDPDRLAAQAAAAASSNDSYRVVTDAERTRATFSASELRAATARARAVEIDPATYLAGEALSASSGACVPLPPGSGDPGYYEATCNSGTKVDETAPVCRVPLVVTVERGPDRYQYVCEDQFDRFSRNGQRLCLPFQPSVDAGVCREIDRVQIGMTCLQGTPQNCTEPGEPIFAITYQCDTPVTQRPYTLVPGSRVVSERRDEATCQAAITGQTCEQTAETCIDSDPQTRTIDGLPVTRACWNWERRYSCHRFSAGNDCAALEANRQCSFLRTDCLDDPQAGACRVSEQVYRCPTPGAGAGTDRQYICGGDVYCINGDCEPIVREASTELKDALVALHAIGQAGKEFDPATFSIFSGDRETCHKPVFGLVNCCAGKTSGLLTAAAGGAALAGGPAAIAALATPFLTLFLCSQDEMKLDIKDRMGFCHKLGSYCSKSFLGICTTRRTAFCCFESKLSRILQEQGRPQLGKAWGAPKTESCRGFTVDEFAQLDLSRMDFTEIYAEFLDAAKLPDEVRTLADIQTRIEEYYRLHGGGG